MIYFHLDTHRMNVSVAMSITIAANGTPSYPLDVMHFEIYEIHYFNVCPWPILLPDCVTACLPAVTTPHKQKHRIRSTVTHEARNQFAFSQ